MTLLVRFATLALIAAAGFALPITCVQHGSTSATSMVMIAPAPLQAIGSELGRTIKTSIPLAAEDPHADHRHEGPTSECGKTAPRLADQLATIDAQPFVPGYLESETVIGDAQSIDIELPPILLPAQNRTDAPESPPPRSIS